MINKLLYLFFGLLVINACSNSGNYEQKVNSELNKSIANSAIEWFDIIGTFDEFLTTSGLRQENMTIGEGYLSYLKFRQNFSPQNTVEFKQRQDLKELLIKSGILKNNVIISKKFVECFLPTYKDNRDISDSVFVGTCEIAETLEKIPNISSHAIIGGMLMTYNASDLEKELYQKVIIMTAVIDFIYLNELLSNEISEDNPFKQLIESNENKRKIVTIEE